MRVGRNRKGKEGISREQTERHLDSINVRVVKPAYYLFSRGAVKGARGE